MADGQPMAIQIGGVDLQTASSTISSRPLVAMTFGISIILLRILLHEAVHAVLGCLMAGGTVLSYSAHAVTCDNLVGSSLPMRWVPLAPSVVEPILGASGMLVYPCRAVPS